MAQTFTKITTGLFVNDDRYSEGSSWGDINNDNFLDLFVPDAWDDKTNLLFLNNGDGSFTTLTTGPVVTDTSTSSGGSFGDFNNDGHLDLFVQNYFSRNNNLYINNGDGTFSKITSGNIVSDGGNSFNSSTADYDNDGNLDIFVDNGAFTILGENNFLYKGNGDGTFIKILVGDIVNDGEKSLSSGWCDYDNDDDLDLFTANSDPFNGIAINNFLYQNNGDGTFTKLDTGLIVNDGGISVGVSWGDYDNDLDFDLFVANWYSENNFLYQNNGNGTFTKITFGPVVNDGGHSVGGSWGDYDNDGDLDLYVTNDYNQNNFFYSNNGNGSFTKITTGDLVNDGGRSNGATWADYDNDGYLDLFVPNGAIPSQSNCFYRNNGIFNNNWINIKCVGIISNASAIGTRVKVKSTINGTSLWQVREIFGQTGFNAQNSFNVEFGLGDGTNVDSLIIKWPSGIFDIYSNIEINKFYEAIESQGLNLILSLRNEKNSEIPNRYELFQNYPNPFNPTTTIKYKIFEKSKIILKIFDISGREIKTLVDQIQTPGEKSVEWNGTDHFNKTVASGIYIYQMHTGESNYNFQSRKMLFLK
ncbi:MAG: FG-GAP-like repeat-containing protein [Bacteroidales bacterium]|nr:FG-GAP-like repeat-containing protein [Bacteroidales bacterium]